ncbi:hypothetical protein PIB30_077548 [Stylosanthes scabra]|uniref:Pentatricopeptide repeat-containing protein n=1 Tax=Stylosanthes scabra TaxID=79078 RepID=A0ABU6QQ55_9FABA|nr:hypothetical protein [Stylosanthes scabra]
MKELIKEQPLLVLLPQRLTYPSVFKAFSQLGDVHDGARCSPSWQAITDMYYCKCRSIENAIEVFEASSTRGLSSWNSIIIGLAMNGHEREAIEYFSKLECSSPKPSDSVSFIGVITAQEMKSEMAKWAAETVCELNPSDASGYLRMSNVQAASKQLEEAIIEHKLLMKKSLTEKESGCSSIELDELGFDTTEASATQLWSRTGLYDNNSPVTLPNYITGCRPMVGKISFHTEFLSTAVPYGNRFE